MNRYIRLTSLLSFLIMTQFMCIYFLLVFKFSFYPILGAFWGIVGLVIFIISVPLTVLHFFERPSGYNVADALMFTIVFLSIIVAVINFDNKSSIMNIAGATQLFVFYFIYRNSILSKINVYITLLIMTIIMIVLNFGDVSIRSSMDQTNSLEKVSHQTFAVSYLFVWILASCMEMRFRYLIYAIGAFTLYYNGARTELIIVAISIPILETMRSYRNGIYILIASIFIFFSFYFLSEWLIEIFPDNRTSYLLRDFQFDGSVVERQHINNSTWNVISNNPIFGEYGAYEVGEYGHTILSAWADFGFFGFMLFVFAIILPVWGAFKFRHNKNRIGVEFLTISSIAAVVMFIFSKSYTYPILGINLAIYSRLFIQDRIFSRKKGRSLDVSQRLPSMNNGQFPAIANLPRTSLK
jgi:hypothetical protein